MNADGQRASERQLRFAERQLALLGQCAGDCATGVLDADGIVIDWREGSSPVIGHAADVLGRSFTALLDGTASALALARAEGSHHRDCTLRRMDGSGFPAAIAVDTMAADGGEQLEFCVAVRDLTRQRRWQQQLDETRAQLFHCQKIEAVGQLTGGIAHDFNNLLQGIVGSLNVIAMQLERGSTDNLAHFVAHATASAHGASALTHRLLTLAQPQPAQSREVDVNALVTSMADLFARTLGEHIGLHLELASGLKPVFCDAHQLESVLLNLAINARDAMPHGGELTFATHDAPPDAERPGQHCLCLEVRDSGSGMDASTRARALEPFFTTKPAGRGTGLGLSMIRMFIDQAGGAIELDSEPGRGTAVRIRLPCCSGASATAAAPGRTVPRAVAVPERTVLVVEDSTMVRELIAATLRDRRYRVLEAGNGPEGLALLQSDVRIDLVISDVGLPGMKGPAMIDAIPSRAAVKLLFITGHGQAPPVADGNGARARAAWLSKPFSMQELMDRVASLLP